VHENDAPDRATGFRATTRYTAVMATITLVIAAVVIGAIVSLATGHNESLGLVAVSALPLVVRLTRKW
jgi:hypothetical protein